MTDAGHPLLLAESLLQLVELVGGPGGAKEARRAQGPEAGGEVAAALDGPPLAAPASIGRSRREDEYQHAA